MNDTGRLQGTSMTVEVDLRIPRVYDDDLVQVAMSMRLDGPVVQAAACRNRFDMHRRLVRRLRGFPIQKEGGHGRRRLRSTPFLMRTGHVRKVQVLGTRVHS